MTLTAATCFSGIGAPEVAMPHWDWKFHADIEKFPNAVIANRHPNSLNLGDVLAPDFIERAVALGQIDIMAGGPPCQGFSIAGLRGGMSDPRGNLTLRWVQILHAIKPRNAVTENVPGWLSMPDNAFGSFLAGLVGADDALHSPLDDGKWPSQGMASGPRARCAWRVFDAQYFGVAQRRRRVFVVADFGNGADPAKVLFNRKSVSGNNPPRRKTGKDIAGTLEARSGGGGGGPAGGTDGACAGYLQPVSCARLASFGEYVEDNTASTIKQRDHKDATDQISCVSFKPSHYTRGKDGAPSDIAPPLRAMPHDKSHMNGVGQMAVAFMENQQGQVWLSDQVNALSQGGGKPGQGYPAVAIQAGALRENPNSGPDGVGVQEDIAYTLEVRAEVQAVSQGWAVRRLTPVEAARLQGFDDDYLDIQFSGKPAADTHKYRALGNSWAVPCGRWILERIERFMTADNERAERDDKAK